MTAPPRRAAILSSPARGYEGKKAYALASSLRAEVERGGGATLSLDLRPDASAAELAGKFQTRKGQAIAGDVLAPRPVKVAKIEMALLREASPLGLPRENEALARLIENIPLSITGVASINAMASCAAFSC